MGKGIRHKDFNFFGNSRVGKPAIRIRDAGRIRREAGIREAESESRNPKAGKLESEWIMPEPRFGKPDGSCWEDLGLGVRIGTCIHGRYTERMIRGGLRRED